MIPETKNGTYNLNKMAFHAFLWNHGLFVIDSLILALTTYVLANFLEPEGYGIYTAVMSFGALASMLVSFGYEGALNVFLPRLRGNLQRARYLFRQMLWRRATLVLFFFCALILVSTLWGTEWIPAGKKLVQYLPLAVLCGFISLITGLLVRSLLTYLTVKPLAVIRIGNLIVTLIMYFAFLLSGYGIKTVLWITVITSMTAMLLYFLVSRHLVIGPVEKFNTKAAYKFGLTAWANDLIGFVLGKNTDIILMIFYGVAKRLIGFYQIAFTLIAYVRMITTKGMTGILQSAFSSAYHDGGTESLGRWWRLTMKFHILATTPGVLFLALFSRPLFETLLPDYTGAGELLRSYGFLVLAATMLGGGTHITAFYAMGKQNVILFTRLTAGILNLVLDIILIYYLGALGALIATGLSAVLAGGFELSIICSRIGVSYPLTFLMKCFVCLGGAGALTSIVAGPGTARIILSAILFVLSYLIVAWLIRPLEKTDITHISHVNFRLASFLRAFSVQTPSELTRKV